jgi:O-antigen ligase
MVWRSGILRQGGFRDYSIYLIWAFASSIYSLLPTVSFGRALAATLPFIALCAISLKVKNGQDARRAMGVLLTGCGVVVAINLVGLIALSGDVAWHPDPDTGMLRYNGIFTEPNEIGSLMLATLGAGFGYWPIARRWKKVLAGAAMGCAIVLAVFADSRSPLAAIAIGGFIYLLWRYRLKGIIGVAVLIALFYAVTFILPASHDYLDRGDVTSFTGRQVAWDFARQSIKERPLFGYGFEVEGQILLSQYFPGWDDVWSDGYQSSLHNGFLSRAVSLGIPALLLWLFIMSRTMLSLFLSNGDPWSLRSMALLSLLPVIVLNFTESVPDFRSFAGLEMGLAWALLERERLFHQAQALQLARFAEDDKSPIVRALQTRPAG